MSRIGDEHKTPIGAADEQLAESLFGLTSFLPNDLAVELRTAMVARLLRTAQAAGLSVLHLDLVEAVLLTWVGSIGSWRVSEESPLIFGAPSDELAELAGWEEVRAIAGLTELHRAGAIELRSVEPAAGSTLYGTASVLLEISLHPLLKRELGGTAAALRRLWVSRHFRALRHAWVARVDELNRFLATVEPGVAGPAGEVVVRWRGFAQKWGERFDELFDDASANVEAIYASFAELCELDEMAQPIARPEFAVGEPLVKVLAAHAGARAQIRHERRIEEQRER